MSVDSAGNQSNNQSLSPSISADGRFVAFQSYASNLVPGDTNGQPDVLVHDLQTGQTARVSVDSAGSEGNNSSSLGSISGDGRHVAFWSSASNLVPGDTNGQPDVFVHDLQTGQTARVSVDSDGTQGDGSSLEPDISGEGRYVAFKSLASNLVPSGTAGRSDIYVHDRQTGITERVSVDSSGAQGNGFSDMPSISTDGRHVAFRSYDNLVSGDTNGLEDIYVHDRQTGITQRVSVDSSGAQSNGFSATASISAAGRFVAFASYASNLVSGDTNGEFDIFLHDRETGTTERVSVDSSGAQGDDQSIGTSISADGRFVAFVSGATNLVPGDTNGQEDIFLHDRQTGITERVAVDSSGAQANFNSGDVATSANGRSVAFHSYASNLVSDDTNHSGDVFVRYLFDGDGDDIADQFDNCPTAPNPTQADDDGDGAGNACDTCPPMVKPWAVPPDDFPDCDGFPRTTQQGMRGPEAFIGTDPDLACGVNAWPVDNNDDYVAGLGDILRYIPVFGANNPPPPAGYNARFDLNADNKIGLQDILIYIPFFNLTCTP